ncbi:MAG: transglutaminase-like cysteine peptidase, partial [Flavobacteriaceae bacterium]|nr:transglutaminase-like cysteine peptidase [Flavobacteriaceae bacterium]
MTGHTDVIRNYIDKLRYALAIWLLLSLSLSTIAIGPLRFTPELFNRIEQEYGSSARERVADWQQELLELQSEDIDEQLYEINRFFNAIPYYEDSVHWKQDDYWATPVEMLGTYGGDCEDYTIAKYFSLRALGVPEENMRMMYVKALDYNQAHMVLAYYS